MFTLLPIHSLINILSFISITKAAIVNVTVDDTNPDPLTGVRITYLPETGWNNGPTCTTCSATPDGRQMYANTWHDSTFSPGTIAAPPTGPQNASFTFSGTAIYVFCALALASTSTFTAYTNMSFYIDGETVGNFEREPPGMPGYEYNVPVYSNTALPPGQHVLVLENGNIGNGGDLSLTLLDYLIYSYDNEEAGSSSSPSATVSDVETDTSSSTTSVTTVTLTSTTFVLPTTFLTSSSVNSISSITSSTVTSKSVSSNAVTSLSTLSALSTKFSIPVSSNTSTATSSSTLSMTSEFTSTSSTSTSPTSSSSHSSRAKRIGEITAGVTGGVVAISLIIWFLLRRRRHSGRKDIDPFVMNGSVEVPPEKISPHILEPENVYLTATVHRKERILGTSHQNGDWQNQGNIPQGRYYGVDFLDM